ncbi:phosphate signaling complex protein PhoU [Caldithrix abyssi]|uniref:Phosphate-specific transport system accessory protein PhoU n=1 Tax=Caldithrix abyssi DSM 13497 TaxID=880073 RepID=H1XRY9_CALAY|nr:phosphate signaling complex protein PhoU [Caldithrix abyssi]APF18479.1 phosphate uptake regulator, PhoU [Caldithrix abyssi DSM 13497]EHO42482.1 phosphate uptake regulator, PhoU [Caldithrix abyssi DSM 13497]
MSIHLQKDIEKLKKKVLTLSMMVEETLYDAVTALKTQNKELAQRVIENDEKIDNMEVEVENDCLKILALHQPVAIDLRYVISVLKINNDLERVGDLASNIAQRAMELMYLGQNDLHFDLDTMFEKVKIMLKNSLKALINLDIDEAKSVLQMDDEVDAMHRSLYQLVAQKLAENPQKAAIYLQYISISRYLERIADLATNIAEDVIYMVEGTIARHSPEKFQ